MIEITPYTLTRVIESGIEMLDAQQLYFNTRGAGALAHCKKLEAKYRRLLLSLRQPAADWKGSGGQLLVSTADYEAAILG